MNTVTGTVVEAGSIVIEYNGDMRTYERALLIEFDNLEDFKAALTSTKNIRTEWMVPNGDRK